VISPGADPRPEWPGTASSAVCLAFDLDGPTGDALLSGAIWERPSYFSQGAYGPWRAVDRLLRLLDDFGVPATFFVPGWVVEHWPDQCRRIVAAGHEVGHHGYRHEKYWDLTDAQQRAVIERSQDIFGAELGCVARGFRTPSGDWRPGTPELLVELGFTYSSSLRGDDRPYRHPRAAGLIEIPARSELDDYTSLAYTRNPDWPSGGARIASYADTLDSWIRDFDAYHAEGLCLTTIFHPKFVGRPGPARLLGEWLRHMHDTEGVWFARLGEVADWWASRG